MGIDPQTHKSISPTNSDITHLPENDQSTHKPPQKPTSSSLSSPQEELDDKESAGDDMMDLIVDGFGIDEIPLIEPHEILVPCDSSSSSTTTSTSYSSSSSNNSYSSFSSNSKSAANLLQDLVNEFPEFEWPNICENGIQLEELLDDDFGSWDFVVNNNYENGSGNNICNNNPCVVSNLELDNPQSWAYGLLL